MKVKFQNPFYIKERNIKSTKDERKTEIGNSGRLIILS